MKMKYYVVVELRDYQDNKIGESSCTCEEDISRETIVASARIAAELMVDYHVDVKREQRGNRKADRLVKGDAANDRRLREVMAQMNPIDPRD